MHAPIAPIGTATSKRRAIQRATARRNSTEPMLGGYPRSAPEVANASTTAGGGGSIGVPIERSTAPPGKRSATGSSRSSRS